MDIQEKSLYHQIHPAKLFIDWSTGLIALYPLWQHDLVMALLIAIAPSILASLIIVRFVDLEPYKQSRFGKYVHRYMNRPLEATRFAGYALMAVGAWSHTIWVVPIGLLVIILAWLRGVILPGK